jgi:hypothetical protein
MRRGFKAVQLRNAKIHCPTATAGMSDFLATLTDMGDQ